MVQTAYIYLVTWSDLLRIHLAHQWVISIAYHLLQTVSVHVEFSYYCHQLFNMQVIEWNAWEYFMDWRFVLIMVAFLNVVLQGFEFGKTDAFGAHAFEEPFFFYDHFTTVIQIFFFFHHLFIIIFLLYSRVWRPSDIWTWIIYRPSDISCHRHW